ncbi:MAG: SoxR reducing system RseC family protein [Rikenellaceae bacterium]
METKDIRHRGQIVRIEGHRVTVSFMSQGGCGSCHARGKCGMVESDKREIEIEDTHASKYREGDDVTISVTMSMGRTAVILAYVVPLVLLIILMSVGSVINLAEWGVALMGLCGVALYYTILYWGRKKIDKKINFTITN